jgi:hypothetical protein
MGKHFTVHYSTTALSTVPRKGVSDVQPVSVKGRHSTLGDNFKIGYQSLPKNQQYESTYQQIAGKIPETAHYLKPPHAEIFAKKTSVLLGK